MTVELESREEDKKFLLCVGSQTGPHTWRGGKIQRKADHFKLIDCSFNKLGRLTNLPTKLVLGDVKTSRCPQLPIRILKTNIETLPGFSHICLPDGLRSTLLSQKYLLRTALVWEWGWSLHSKDKGGSEEPLIGWV